jgi:hypothetical protein
MIYIYGRVKHDARKQNPRRSDAETEILDVGRTPRRDAPRGRRVAKEAARGTTATTVTPVEH